MVRVGSFVSENWDYQMYFLRLLQPLLNANWNPAVLSAHKIMKSSPLLLWSSIFLILQLSSNVKPCSVRSLTFYPIGYS